MIFLRRLLLINKALLAYLGAVFKLRKWNEIAFVFCFNNKWAFLVAQIVKNMPTMQETQVWSLGQNDPLEKQMATHSSILDWRISWTEEPGGLQSMGLQRVGHDWATNTHTQVLLPHWCNGHELGQALGDGEGQRGFVCCSPWAHKELDMTVILNNNYCGAFLVAQR